jgi:hypothetical protein
MSRTGHITGLNLAKYVERDYEETDSKKGWINYGEDNLFPQYLIDLYNSSAVHNALVNSIAYMIFGEGVKLDGEAQLTIEQWGLNDELLKASVDLKLQGGFYLEVSWSLDRSRIKSVRHIPFEEFRAGHMEVDGRVPWYYHCLDWEEVQKIGYTEIKSFDPSCKKDHPVQVLVCKPFSVGSHYYPKPDYMGAINWIEVDKQIAVFHNNNIANGMAPSFAINWKNGVPPKEERDAVKREIEEQMTGARNAGKFFMTFSPRGSEAPDFEPFALSDAHNQYQFLSSESTDKIMIGHRVVTPAMFGVKTSGQLGSTEELKVGSMLFERNVIKPYQRIIRDCVDILLAENGISQQAKMNVQPLFLKKEIEPVPYLRDDQGKEILSYLKEVGHTMDKDEWELIDECEVDAPNQEYKFHLKKHKFFSQYADPDSKSKVDTGLYKIRYRYSQNISNDSREFCTIMVEESKSKTVYKFEDIIEMGDSGVNGQFAPEGENAYSIWLWKGGCYCHHMWVRQVYFRKRNKGRFLPNDGLKNDALVEGTPDIPLKEDNFPQANTRPIDTPSRGSLKNK